jgi:hypothetical protein
MVWRLNDSWPILYWSVIDYYLEPKIPYYYLRRAYDPVLVSFEKTPDRISVWVVNDSPEAAEGTLTVERIDFKGEKKGRLTKDVRVESGDSERALSLTKFGPVSLREEFLSAEFAGRNVLLLLAAERYLHLPRAGLRADRIADQIVISTDHFAYQVELRVEDHSGVYFDDNFFHMRPGETRHVEVIGARDPCRISVKAFNSDPVLVDIEDSKS